MEDGAKFSLNTEVGGEGLLGSASPHRTDAPNAEMLDRTALLNGDTHFI